jgi:CDP-glucose 4,6-dehydratase
MSAASAGACQLRERSRAGNFLTGHTGFIGGWTAAALQSLGAEVHGYALAPPTTPPSFFAVTGLEHRVMGTFGDVRGRLRLLYACALAKPDRALHLAARPLVSVGYSNAVETFETNVLGTVNVLECVRQVGAAAVLVMTSDKVYRYPQSENREDDELGGGDPYGGSKACAEIVSEVCSKSFFAPRSMQLATARAGNVIGGGDWAAFRLIPDAVHAFGGAGRALSIRHPDAVRPWQHVLDAVYGLLLVAERMVQQPNNSHSAWNIVPPQDEP